MITKILNCALKADESTNLCMMDLTYEWTINIQGGKAYVDPVEFVLYDDTYLLDDLIKLSKHSVRGEIEVEDENEGDEESTFTKYALKRVLYNVLRI